MNIIGIIPARMASTRFPGKPLALINSIPMIGHVYYRSVMCSSLNDIYVATCDIEIKEYIESIGGKVVMTSSTHESATSRTSEAMLVIEKSSGTRVDIAVMIQGDEPMLIPDMIDEAILPIIENPEIVVVNLSIPLKTEEEHRDPNEVKVVVDMLGFALYFSREPIPSRKINRDSSYLIDSGLGNNSVIYQLNRNSPYLFLKQVCIIPFRRDFLVKFNTLAPSPLEMIESIDMLRVIEHGYKVKMVCKEYQSYSVNTPEDLRRVEQLMSDDALVLSYPIKGKR
jgi:3-deoxy-manno-octulosonate cytidylyltransferase (CMP-KDO synthetase)